MAAAGYRAVRNGAHYRIIQSLAFTIEAGTEFIAKLDSFRKKRNISDYERTGLVSEMEARDMLALARSLRSAVARWLKEKHPQLLES